MPAGSFGGLLESWLVQVLWIWLFIYNRVWSLPVYDSFAHSIPVGIGGASRFRISSSYAAHRVQKLGPAHRQVRERAAAGHVGNLMERGNSVVDQIEVCDGVWATRLAEKREFFLGGRGGLRSLLRDF